MASTLAMISILAAHSVKEHSCQRLGIGLERVDMSITPATGTVDVNRLHFEGLGAAAQSIDFRPSESRVKVEPMFR